MNSSDTLQLDFKRSERQPVRLQPRAWRGFNVERVTLESDAPYDFRGSGETHYLALHDMRLLDGELVIDGLAPARRNDLRDTLTFAPRGCSIAGWAKPRRGHNGYTAIYIDPNDVCEELDRRYARANPRPFAYARDAALLSTMSKIKDLVASPDADSLYAEALCLTAALEILGVPPAGAVGQLTKAQIDRLSDYVDAQLHRALSLDELAGVIGLSRSHFSRSFKAATGIGPYRFVTGRRIERACTMLRGAEKQSIAAIGQAVGFNSASAFRRVFQQSVGVGPTTYRSMRR